MTESTGGQHSGKHHSPAPAGGWRVGQSLPLELDLAIWLLDERARQPLARIPQPWYDLVERLDPAWLAELPAHYLARSGPTALLEWLARWAGVLYEADYSRSTLAMRTLTTSEVLATLQEQVETAGLAVAAPGTVAEQIATLSVRLRRHTYRSLNLEPAQPEALERQVRAEVTAATAVLHDSPRHARFWHWLDRFFYEAYRPWRQTRAGVLAARHEEALAALGTARATGVPPLDWLPAQNPLRYRSELAEAVQAGSLHVFFWVEPLDMVDVWFLFPGEVAVALARPGEIYENFRAYAEDVAVRTKALSDPTRLLILRLIRNLSMDNTSMAEFLEVTRPTVSVHTKILREAGLIRTRRVGRKAQHEIVLPALHRLFDDLERFLDLPTAEEE